MAALPPGRFTSDPIKSIDIPFHSTRSNPQIHVVYAIDVKTANGKSYTVYRRFREFRLLQDTLATSESFQNGETSLPSLPAVPSLPSPSPYAFLDDALIAGRKEHLSKYLNTLISGLDSDHGSAQTPSTALRPRETMSVINFLSQDAADDSSVEADQSATSLSAAARVPAPVIGAYYADWTYYSGFTPAKIDFTKLNTVFFAFVVPTSTGSLKFSDPSSSPSILKSLVTAAHAKNVRVLLSVGGWGGSQNYSTLMANSSSRGALVDACKKMLTAYSLDGLDFDWEYPGEPGAGNPYNKSDVANFLSFLKALRSAVGSSKIISLAVPTGRIWQGQTDLKGLAQVVNFVTVMNYDVNGSSSTPGPNAPLSDACKNSSQPTANAVGGVAAWRKGGFAASQIVLGLPAYGYVSKSRSTTLQHFVDPSTISTSASVTQADATVGTDPATRGRNVKFEGPKNVPTVRKTEPSEVGGESNGATVQASDEGQVSEQAAAKGDLSAWAGQQINFKDIVDAGGLVWDAGSKVYQEANGNVKNWDDCSDTPFLVNQARRLVCTYDDPDSIYDKAAYAKSVGCGGCAFWELSGDDRDNGFALLSAARKGLGLR